MFTLAQRSRTGAHACALWLAAASALASAAPTTPMLVHQADRILVPSTSPLRLQLAVGAVGVQAAPHSVSAPAVVEANPARVVAVLPPLSGRLVGLKVGLGDAVRRGQTLELISSPDFAQAEGDAIKAADALDLAKRTLERSRGVMATGANAAKDLEAAQSALVLPTLYFTVERYFEGRVLDRQQRRNR